MRELGEELGDSISLRLDANRAWGYEEAAEFVRGAPRFEYLEEPLADPARLPELAREFGVPVALDESLVGMEPEELEEHRYARAVVLKPTLLGGISRTLRMAERALQSRHDTRRQLGLRERRRDGRPRGAGSGYRRASRYRLAWTRIARWRTTFSTRRSAFRHRSWMSERRLYASRRVDVSRLQRL